MPHLDRISSPQLACLPSCRRLAGGSIKRRLRAVPAGARSLPTRPSFVASISPGERTSPFGSLPVPLKRASQINYD